MSKSIFVQLGPQSNLSIWVKAFAIFALVFAIASVTVLFYPPISDLSSYGHLSALSGALSSAFSLIIGFLAVVIVATTARSDFRASEKVKEDLATIHSVFHNMCHKYALYTQTANDKLLDIEKEKEELEEVIYGSTGFALQMFAAKKNEESGHKEEEWRVFFLLVNTITSKRKLDGEVMENSYNLMNLLSNLTKNDISEMSAAVDNLPSALSKAGEAQKKDPIIQAVHSRYDNRPSFKQILNTFYEMKRHGIADPDIDIFLAIEEGDIEKLRQSLREGANLNIRPGEIMKRYPSWFE